MDDIITSDQEELIERAAAICLLIPNVGTNPGDLHQNIMSLAGLPEELAVRESYQRCLQEKIKRQEHVQNTYSRINSDEAKKDRALDLFQLFKEGGKSVKRTELMRLVGYPEDEVKGKHYQSLKRAMDRRLVDEQDTPSILTDVSQDMNVEKVLSPMSSMSAKLSKLQISKQQKKPQLSPEELQELRLVAYKVATIIYRAVLEGGGLPHQHHLATSDKCAQAVNALFQFERGAVVVTGAELREGWRIGMPAPMERACLLVEEDVELLSTLIYTMMALDQANPSSKPMTRPELVSLLGAIVNHRHHNHGSTSTGGTFHELSLYEMIQGRNFYKQALTKGPNLDALRLNWLTYHAQLRHYTNWEDACMKRGFARLTKSDMEFQKEGHIVFTCPMSRMINFGQVTLNLNVSDRGASPEDNGKCTIMLGIAGNEPLPPLFIFASKTNQMTVSPEQIMSMHQVRGQYGADKATAHSVSFAFNEKGCVNSKIFTSWICEKIMNLYPDAANVDGKRVMMRADCTPEYFSKEFVSRTHAGGFDFFSSLPIPTRVGQEVDHLFSAFKSCCYQNMDKLTAFRKKEGETTTITTADVGHIVFGGEIKSKTCGNVVTLPNAFETCFSARHIQAAREKCGYCPATRNGLNGVHFDRQVVQSIRDGAYIHGVVDEMNLSSNPLMILLDEMERQNHRAVQGLEAKGYIHASQAKRFVHRAPMERESVQTAANTGESQEFLERMLLDGKGFTPNGGVMNASDMLLAEERKRMKEEIKKMEDLKKTCKYFSKVAQDGRGILLSKEVGTWKVDDYRKVIRYCMGPYASADDLKGLQETKKAQLVQIYSERYKDSSMDEKKLANPDQYIWTDDMERELQRLKKGTINTVEETRIYGQTLESQTGLLVGKLSSLSTGSVMGVLREVVSNLDDEGKEELKRVLGGS